MKVTLVGGNGRTGRGTHPVEFKIEALRLIVKESLSAKDAIARAAEQFEIELKPSYSTHAGSHKWRFTNEVGRLAKEDPTVAELCEEAGLQFNYEGETA